MFRVGRWFSLSSNECAISSAQFRASSAENVIPTRILRLITRGASSFVTFCAVVFPKEKRILGYGFFRLERMKFHFDGISRNFFGTLSRTCPEEGVILPVSVIFSRWCEIRSGIYRILLIFQYQHFLGDLEIFGSNLWQKYFYLFNV